MQDGYVGAQKWVCRYYTTDPDTLAVSTEMPKIPLDVVGDVWNPAVCDNQPVNVKSLRLKGRQTDVGKYLLYLAPWHILWMERQV
jgi:hypothetical protein